MNIIKMLTEYIAKSEVLSWHDKTTAHVRSIK